MEAKLKRRKLDALKRGVHRLQGGEIVPVSTHVVGVGQCGAEAVAEMLRQLEPGGQKFHALVVDIGGRDLAGLRALVGTIPAERAEVTIVELDPPEHQALHHALRDYPQFLALEYPLYAWGAAFQSWLPARVSSPSNGHLERAVAKAVYGVAYYSGMRPMHRALRAFSDRVEASRAQVVIAVVFGLGGGTGSGIAVDLARHLSSSLLGRRALVAGIGIAPCSGDLPEHGTARLFPVLNELDCLGDESKNSGIVASCGELFRNPFTAGFIVVPQSPVWDATRDLGRTHERVDQEIALLLTARGGLNLYETLRLLNWVAAPSTQHSAARTPWGPRWIHVLAFADAEGPVAVTPMMAAALGLLPEYVPEFIEIRVEAPDDASAKETASLVDEAFHPDVPPQLVPGGRPGSVQFILPCISKTNLAVFFEAREAYDAERHDAKVLDHSMLLEQGVLLSEPSTRLEGMAGESLAEGSWIAVPLMSLRGGDPPPCATTQQRLHELGYAD